MKLFPARPMVWAGVTSLTVAGAAAASATLSVAVATAVPVFLLLVIVTAWRAGFRASLTVSLAATLSLDYFLTVPRYSLEIASTSDVVMLLTFAAVAVLVSQLSHRTRLRSDQLQAAEQQQSALYEFSRSALLIDWSKSVEEQLAHLVFERFSLVGVALYTAEEQRFCTAGDAHGALDRVQAAFRAKRSYDLPNGQERLRILNFGSRPLGVLLLRGMTEPVLADSLATLTATHLIRTKAVQAEVRARSESFSERLRSAVLDGLAHAIKTPLTTIIASSSGLKEIGPLSPVQGALATTIEEQAEHLASVTNTLLRTAHLSTDDVRIENAPVILAALASQVRSKSEPKEDQHRIRVIMQADQTFTTDERLLTLVLQQLVENALRYSPAGSPVTMDVSVVDNTLRIEIHNDGSYIPREERSMIFERYFRAASTAHRASGTGIGLSVARSAVEAMNGRIWVESEPELGTTFFVEVPEASEG